MVEVFDQCPADPAHKITLNSQILHFPSGIKWQKLFSLIMKKKIMIGLISSLSWDLQALQGKNPGDLRASPAPVPILQLLFTHETPNLAGLPNSARSLCKKRTNLFPSFPSDRPPPEGGIKESSSWGTQRTQDVFYETRSPAFERGHSEEIPIERVSKAGGKVGMGRCRFWSCGRT